MYKVNKRLNRLEKEQNFIFKNFIGICIESGQGVNTSIWYKDEIIQRRQVWLPRKSSYFRQGKTQWQTRGTFRCRGIWTKHEVRERNTLRKFSTIKTLSHESFYLGENLYQFLPGDDVWDLGDGDRDGVSSSVGGGVERSGAGLTLREVVRTQEVRELAQQVVSVVWAETRQDRG